MANELSGFSYEISGTDRALLLEEAAQKIDAARGHLGERGAPGAGTPEAATLRALVEDKAALAAMPDVHRINEKDYTGQQLPVPARFRELAKDFKFYEVRFPIGLQPRRNWAFDRLECKVVFNPEGTPEMRPRAWQILPNKKVQELAKIQTHLQVTLDENFEIGGKVGADVGVAVAKADAKAGGTAGLSLAAGPFEYRFTKARVDHSGTGLEWIFWRLDGKEFFQENRPDLIAIVQVPKGAKEFKIDAAIQAYRFFNFATAELQDAIKNLGGALAAFFKAGAPLGDTKQYDLSPQL